MIPRQQKQHTPQSNQSGFTIIESLIAILIVTILLVGLAPVIVLSAATRLQARRIERATEAAKTYVDGVRSGAIPAPNITVGPAPNPTANSGATRFLSAAAAPASGTIPPTEDWTSASGLYCVNLDETPGCSIASPNDLVIQGFRTTTEASVDPASRGYRLGVRVYRANAFNKRLIAGVRQGTTGTISGTTPSDCQAKGVAPPCEAPLVETVTDVVPKENQFGDWCNRLRNAVPNPNSSC